MDFYVLEWLAMVFMFVVGLVALAAVITLIIDLIQTKNAILRNYPVVGHFRGIFSRLGEFFRGYFFAMDREEMPFNRAERNWVEQAASDQDTTSAFGSTKSLLPAGTAIFVNCPFPTLEEDASPTKPLLIGEGCQKPYLAKSFFNISALSFGAISKPAVTALSHGAKMAGCWLNTGEGGLSPYHLSGGADIVFQIGTAKYGVRDDQGELDIGRLKEIAAFDQVKMFEIKFSQGAKPGKGGILPGAKVTAEVSKIRNIPIGKDSISPNGFKGINNVGAIVDFVNQVREATGKPVGIKCVVGAYGWLDQMFAEVNKRGRESAPDFITIDSGDGGSGAAPMPLLDNVGLTIKESLPMVVDMLTKNKLRDRIRVIASGKLLTPANVAWALCAGADFINCGRGFMFSLGCIQAMRCNKNTCPTGVTTHKKRLQRGLDPKKKSVKVFHYATNLRHEVEVIAHACGVPEPRRLRRMHVRIVQTNGTSIPMDELYPEG